MEDWNPGDTAQRWAGEIHGERRKQSDRRMDPHSLNRRLSDVERSIIHAAKDIDYTKVELSKIDKRLKDIYNLQADLAKKVLRVYMYFAAVASVFGVFVVGWTLFGHWLAR